MLFPSPHNFHLVDPSAWPFMVGFGSLNLTVGGVLYMHSFLFGSFVMLLGFFLVLLSSVFWFSDIISEGSYQGFHTLKVKQSLKMGVMLFIISEIMFFSAFFWCYFHSALSPTIEMGLCWPRVGVKLLDPWAIPLLNTLILLGSGMSVTYAHHSYSVGNINSATEGLGLTMILAFVFTGLQGFEYSMAGFTISDSVYGSMFFMATGFHGFHVVIGTAMLTVQLLSTFNYNFTSSSLFGFLASSWYWHFVDVVWLFLFISVYWWGSLI